MTGTRGRGPVRTGVAALVLAGAIGLASSGGAGAASSGDRAATHAYLQATIAFEQATLANEAASSAAQKDLATRLERECPGVLSHAPREGGESGKLAPRVRGELDRARHQLELLESEFGHAMSAAGLAPDRAAILAYAQTMRSLSWSSAGLTAVLRLPAETAELASAPGSVDVCADMRFWVAGGYRKLAAATVVLQEADEALFGALVSAALTGPSSNAEALLAASEGPAERTLARRLAQLSRRSAESPGRREAPARHAARALGLKVGGDAPEAGVAIANGATRAGGYYTIRVLRSPRLLGAPRCSRMIEVEYESSGPLSSSSSSWSAEVCSPRAPSAAVGCRDGVLTVEALTPSSARSARLRLGDGHVLSGPIARIPAKLGGPKGFYFQAVKGPRPVPVSLTLLDASGAPVATIALHSPRGCRKQRASPTTTLARGTTPGGVEFIVSATSLATRHGRELSLSGGPIGEVLGSGESESTRGKAGLYRWEAHLACPPHEAAILFGRLGGAASTVTAQTAAGEVPLSVVTLPASLHVPGRVAYGAFDAPPIALTVRDASGRTLLHEDLSAFATEHREYCEGYAEP